MKWLFIIFLLFLSLSALAQEDINYEVIIRDIPNSSTGGIVGIPRQQAVCLSEAGHLVVMWGMDTGVADFYKTTDRGATWADSLYTGYSEGYRNGHLCVWNDTIYHFSPAEFSTPDRFNVQIIESDNLSVVDFIQVDTNGYSTLGRIIPSGQKTGNNNEMVAIIREPSNGLPFWFSGDRGRTWENQNATVDDYIGGTLRMGLIPVGDSCLALVYRNSDIDVWHFRTSDRTWTRESGGWFIGTNYDLQRVFSAAVVAGKVFVITVNAAVSTYFVGKSDIGSGIITRDTLWTGVSAYTSSPEYVGYAALQVINSLDAVAAFYVHPTDGSSGSSASALYLRIWHEGIWSNELLISDRPNSVNLTAPFIVPASHGGYAYCQFQDANGGHLAVVKINTGITPADIDRAILKFRQGELTLEQVQNLIQQYYLGK